MCVRFYVHDCSLVFTVCHVTLSFCSCLLFRLAGLLLHAVMYYDSCCFFADVAVETVTQTDIDKNTT